MPMSALFGEVIVTELNIRPIAGIDLPAIGKLRHFDLIEASEEFNGWWKLTSIKRGSERIPLPGAACYAYEGMTNGYIRNLAAPVPIPTPSTRTVTGATLRFSDGTTVEMIVKPQ